MNDFHSSPDVLSHRPPGSAFTGGPLAALAFLSLVFDKVRHLRLDMLTQGWHDLLFVLLVTSMSLDLIVELLKSTAAALHGARLKIEPLWPAFADFILAFVALLAAGIPPALRSKWSRSASDKTGEAKSQKIENLRG